MDPGASEQVRVRSRPSCESTSARLACKLPVDVPRCGPEHRDEVATDDSCSKSNCPLWERLPFEHSDQLGYRPAPGNRQAFRGPLYRPSDYLRGPLENRSQMVRSTFRRNHGRGEEDATPIRGDALLIEGDICPQDPSAFLRAQVSSEVHRELFLRDHPPVHFCLDCRPAGFVETSHSVGVGITDFPRRLR